jgi:hypothetical protein
MQVFIAMRSREEPVGQLAGFQSRHAQAQTGAPKTSFGCIGILEIRGGCPGLAQIGRFSQVTDELEIIGEKSGPNHADTRGHRPGMTVQKFFEGPFLIGRSRAVEMLAKQVLKLLHVKPQDTISVKS